MTLPITDTDVAIQSASTTFEREAAMTVTDPDAPSVQVLSPGMLPSKKPIEHEELSVNATFESRQSPTGDPHVQAEHERGSVKLV